MKYYRYIITSIIIFIAAIEAMKNGYKIDRLGNIGITMLFSGIVMLALAITGINIYKFIKVRISLKDEELIKWSFNNEEWRRYINNETKERLKYLGSGLKYVYIIYILYAIVILEEMIKGTILIENAKPVIMNFIAVGLVATIVVLLYNFTKIMFFYFININSNGEIIMTAKVILINGELNDPDNFLRRFPKTTIVQRQYSIYYDDSIQLNILKVESGEIERAYRRGDTLKVLKIIRIPINDDCNIGVIKRTFKIKINQSKQRCKTYSKSTLINNKN